MAYPQVRLGGPDQARAGPVTLPAKKVCEPA